MKERLFQIALTKIPLVGPKSTKNLIAYCGGVEAVFREKKKNLLKIPNIGMAIVDSILNTNPEEAASDVLAYVEKNNIGLSFYLEPDYPSRLKNYDDAPCLLYYKGLANWNHHRTISIVGTRKPTHYGDSLCSNLVEELAAYDVHLFSGLAHGVDSLAHQKCLDVGIPTSAIMATGIETIYPATNRRLSSKILDVGSLITECPPFGRVDADNFPRRNRIIAALSDAVVVVESAIKGGSLITAEYANAYHKDVFAFPGRASDKSSAGCNALIKTHKAHLLESAADIALMMNWQTPKPKGTQIELFVELDHTEELVMGLLRQHDSLHLDMLHAYLNLSLSIISSTLLQLEFKGLVKSLPGKMYTKSI